MREYLGVFRGRTGVWVCHGIKAILLITATAMSGCAAMGPAGGTRLDAARALGLKPEDVIVVSRDYELTGAGGSQLALSKYTIKTRSDLTYTCTVVPASGNQTDPNKQVCVPKD